VPVDTAGPRNRTRRQANKVNIKVTDPEIPNSIKEAKNSKEWPQWEQAIYEELHSFKENGMGRLVPRPPNRNVISSRFVFDLKKKAQGETLRYKARFAARGFTQKEGIDYLNTSSPVIKSASMKLLLTVAAVEDMDIEQMDVMQTWVKNRIVDPLVVD